MITIILERLLALHNLLLTKIVLPTLLDSFFFKRTDLLPYNLETVWDLGKLGSSSLLFKFEKYNIFNTKILVI